MLKFTLVETSKRTTNMRYSALAGALAALAGMFGKLGADGDSLALQILLDVCQDAVLPRAISCTMIQSGVRLLCVGAMLATNALMLSFFVKGLHETDSLTATVTSAAVNFVLSAAGGFVLFQEHLPTRWFFGATIILAGMACLLHGDTPVEQRTEATAEEPPNSKKRQ